MNFRYLRRPGLSPQKPRYRGAKRTLSFDEEGAMSSELSDKEDSMCIHCDGYPFHWVEHGDNLKQHDHDFYSTC